MKSAPRFSSALPFLVIVFFLSSFISPYAWAEDPEPPDSDSVTITDDAIIYTADLEKTGKYDTFVGGGACCDCDVKHYGKIPEGFPENDIIAVSFYANTSRINSRFDQIEVGPTQLKLRLGDREAIATSAKVTADMSVPESGANWHITFLFDPPVEVKVDTEWELSDGDNNMYSAIFGLHSGDVKTKGLPGSAETFPAACTYARVNTPVYYSAKFYKEGATIPVFTPVHNITTDVDYTSIQNAVNAASEDDTIQVDPGYYLENVKIDVDNLTIQSIDGADNTIVRALNTGDHVFAISSDGVTISGFTVQKAGTGNTGGSKGGIYLDGAWNCTISDNVIDDNAMGIWLAGAKKNGLWFQGSDHNSIKDNIIESNGGGIYVQGGYVNDSRLTSDSNTIENNTITSNAGWGGIGLDGAIDNQIKDNYIADTVVGSGIHLVLDAEGTIITGNTIESSEAYGINIGSDPNNKDNKIYHNNFIDNATQAHDAGSNNSWHSDSDPEGGNYWSDWTCPDQQDNDGDGYVDEPEEDGDDFVVKPYDGITGNTSTDDLPFINMNGWISDKKGVHNIDTKKSFDSIEDAIDDEDTVDGHTIMVDPGTYPENVDVWKSVTIQGRSECEMPVVEGFEVYYTDNVTIRGFEIKTDYYDSGIELEYSNHALIEHNKITGLETGIDLWDSDYAEIRNNKLAVTEWGIYLYKSGTVSVHHNTVTSGTYAGIAVYETNNTTIEDNEVKSGGVGIDIWDSTNNTIQRNTVEDNKSYGIALEDSNHHHLSYNTVTLNDDGIMVDTSDNVTISKSTVSSNRDYGIWVGYSSKITVENNKPAQGGSISANASAGIRLYKSSDCDIMNNTLTDNEESGIDLYYSNGNRIGMNITTGHKETVEGNYPDSGILLDDSSKNNVYENVLEDNDYGIQVDASPSRSGVTSNNNKFVGNTISSNDYGIKLEHAYSGTITQNTISYNTTYGINSDTSTGNMIFHNNIIGTTGAQLAYDSGTNTWDNEIDQGGNYWSDWTSPDTEQPKGIIDTPRIIPGDGNQDLFPLASENGWKTYAPPKIHIQQCDFDWPSGMTPDYHPGETVKVTCKLQNQGAGNGKSDLKIELLDPNGKVDTSQESGSHDVLANSDTTVHLTLSLSDIALAGNWTVRATAWDGTTDWDQKEPAATFTVYERLGIKITKVDIDKRTIPSSGTVTATVDFKSLSNTATFYKITAKLIQNDGTVKAEQSTSGDDILAVGGTYSADLKLGLADSDPEGQYWIQLEAYWYDVDGSWRLADSHTLAGPTHKYYVYETDIKKFFTQNEGGDNEITVHIRLLDANGNEIEHKKILDKKLKCQTWYGSDSPTGSLITDDIITDKEAAYYQVKIWEDDWGYNSGKHLYQYGDNFWNISQNKWTPPSSGTMTAIGDRAVGIKGEKRLLKNFPSFATPQYGWGCNQTWCKTQSGLDNFYDVIFIIHVYDWWGQGPLTVLQLNSPADLHLYDSQGRHVGANEEGGLDLEIPDVYYSGPDAEPEIMKIFSDIGETMLFVEGQGEGTFDLTMTKSTLMGDQQVVYDDVPISLGSQARIDDTAEEDYTMHIDADGDGTFEGERAPDAKTFDSDHDGVSDDLDFCGGTFIGAEVDEYGCPSDSDGDGVYDGLDICPWFDDNLDTDGNGIPDGCDIDEEREPHPKRELPPDRERERTRDEDDGDGTSLTGFPWIILWIFLGIVAIAIVGRKVLPSPKMISVPRRAPKPPAEPQTYCSKCGTPNAVGSAFCKKCGTPLKQ